MTLMVMRIPPTVISLWISLVNSSTQQKGIHIILNSVVAWTHIGLSWQMSRHVAQQNGFTFYTFYHQRTAYHSFLWYKWRRIKWNDTAGRAGPRFSSMHAARAHCMSRLYTARAADRQIKKISTETLGRWCLLHECFSLVLIGPCCQPVNQ